MCWLIMPTTSAGLSIGSRVGGSPIVAMLATPPRLGCARAGPIARDVDIAPAGTPKSRRVRPAPSRLRYGRFDSLMGILRTTPRCRRAVDFRRFFRPAKGVGLPIPFAGWGSRPGADLCRTRGHPQEPCGKFGGRPVAFLDLCKDHATV